MGIMVRDVVLCALILVQLLSVAHCYRGIRSLLDDGTLALPTPPLSTPADKTNVLRSYLVRKNSFQTGPAKPRSAILREAVKHSQTRIHQRQEKLQRNAVGSESLESPVSYGDGGFDMIISVGTPPQQLIVEVDTGSRLNWVQCAPCLHCFKQPDALFNPNASSSYLDAGCKDPMCEELNESTCGARNTCDYSHRYGDGSVTNGNLAYDTFTLGNSYVPHIAFGCGHNNSGIFPQEDGLMGLGRGPLTLPWQLSKATSSKTFSYCLVDQYSAGTASSPIIFGDATEHSNATYTPLLTNPDHPSYYYVNVTGISVGGLRVEIPYSSFQLRENGGGGVILDSGATISCWGKEALRRMVKAFHKQIAYPEVSGRAYELNLCYNVSGSSLPFPGMTVHMTNVDLEIDPSHLFHAVNEVGDTVCLLMFECDDISIIGSIQQENYLVVHDVDNMRIGFQPMQCDTLW